MSAPVQKSASLFGQLNGELWLARRIALHGVKIFEGDTNPAVRRERFREGIKAHGLESVVCGSKNGKPVLYSQAFERLYGEKL